MHPGGHQPGNMRDIGNHDGPHGVPDLGKARKVDDARIGRAPAEDQLGPVLFGQRFDLVEVDLAGVPPHSVLHGLVVHPRDADPITVRQMTSVRQRQAHDCIARRAQADVHGLIGRRARIGLHIDVLGTKNLLGALDAEPLDLVDFSLALVVARACVAFGILIRQD